MRIKVFPDTKKIAILFCFLGTHKANPFVLPRPRQTFKSSMQHSVGNIKLMRIKVFAEHKKIAILFVFWTPTRQILLFCRDVFFRQESTDIPLTVRLMGARAGGKFFKKKL